MASWCTFEHTCYDIRISVDKEDGRACLEFGDDLLSRMEISEDYSMDDIPIDGEVIRAAGRLYEVGLMDTSDPPLLHEVSEEPDVGLWWDADER